MAKISDKEIKSKVSEGFIHIRTIIEILGKPKEHVQLTMKNYLQKIKDDKNFVVVKEEVEKPKAAEEMFSMFAELELLVKDTAILVGFCFDYMPASVEILAPEQIFYETNDFSDLLNDLQARLHAVNIGAQEMKQHNENLLRNSSALIQNFITHLLSEQRTLQGLSRITGIKESELDQVLSIMAKEGKIRKKGDTYSQK